MDLTQIASSLEKAKREVRPVPQVTSLESGFSLSQAYEVQALLLKSALKAGDALSGYKMGLTSRAKQRDVGVSETIRGFLLQSYEVSGTLPVKGRIHPRVEPEIAVVLKHDLVGPGIGLKDVMGALKFVGPALEVVDSRYENFKFHLNDVVADNTSASAYVVGKKNYLSRLDDLRLLGITVRKNGEVLETGAPAAVLGDPLLAVVELANALGTLEKDKVILTGGITASIPVKPGDKIEAAFPGETLTLEVV